LKGIIIIGLLAIVVLIAGCSGISNIVGGLDRWDSDNNVALSEGFVAKGNFTGAHWECHDSYTVDATFQAGQSSERWWKDATVLCKKRCSESTGKCGINTFGVS